MAEGAPDAGAARPPRRDAAQNRERVLAAALIAIQREGPKVPMAKIAAGAGVGTGTVYRHFRDREHLLSVLACESYRRVLSHAQLAAAAPGTALDALRVFLEATIAASGELALPLHGGPITVDEESVRLRSEIRRTLERVLRRGRKEGMIRPELSATDVIVFGAMLAEPLPHVPDWTSVARRQAGLFLAGAADRGGERLPGRAPGGPQFERSLGDPPR